MNHELREGKYPQFLSLVELLHSADVAFTNFEGAINPQTGDLPPGSRASDPATLDTLRWMGFNLLSLANNHAFEAGEKGIQYTKKIAMKKGFAVAGTGSTLGEAGRHRVPGVLRFQAAESQSSQWIQRTTRPKMQLPASMGILESIRFAASGWMEAYAFFRMMFHETFRRLMTQLRMLTMCSSLFMSIFGRRTGLRRYNGNAILRDNVLMRRQRLYSATEFHVLVQSKSKKKNSSSTAWGIFL